jgi:hypothetical protein
MLSQALQNRKNLVSFAPLRLNRVDEIVDLCSCCAPDLRIRPNTSAFARTKTVTLCATAEL